MDSTKSLHDVDTASLWEEVRRDFPEDELMQEIHYIRLVHHLHIKEMSTEERLRFFSAACREG